MNVATLPQPCGGHLGLGRFGEVVGQALDQYERQPLPGSAVGAGIRRRAWTPQGHAEYAERATAFITKGTKITKTTKALCDLCALVIFVMSRRP